MSAKERERLKIFLRVKRGELQQKEAAALCQLDYRYLRRLYQCYCREGDRGLVHQGRGRPSNRARSAEFKAAVLARYQERYPDFGPTLATEKLAVDGLLVDHETLRKWLMSAGLWQRRRKRKRILVVAIRDSPQAGTESAGSGLTDQRRSFVVTAADAHREQFGSKCGRGQCLLRVPDSNRSGVRQTYCGRGL